MDERSESGGLTRRGLIKIGAVAALVVGAGGAGRALVDSAGADSAGSTVGGATGTGSAGSTVTRAAQEGSATSLLGKPAGGPAYLQRNTYLPFVGTDFQIQRPGVEPLRVKLIEARQLPSVGEAFSLSFQGRQGATVESAVHRFEHPVLGSFDLYIAPVGRGIKHLELEAVINRIGGANG